MSIHVCKCGDEWHLRYPGMTEKEAQSIADRINAGALHAPSVSSDTVAEVVTSIDETKGQA